MRMRMMMMMMMMMMMVSMNHDMPKIHCRVKAEALAHGCSHQLRHLQPTATATWPSVDLY